MKRKRPVTEALKPGDLFTTGSFDQYYGIVVSVDGNVLSVMWLDPDWEGGCVVPCEERTIVLKRAVPE